MQKATTTYTVACNLFAEVCHVYAQTSPSRTFIDKAQVKAALTMEQVARHYGLDILPHEQMHCPFHGEDKNASATVRGNFFYCFTCGVRHDTLGFIIAMEQCSFPDALRIGAEMVGIAPSTSRAQLSYALAKSKHDKKERARIAQASEHKYRILTTIARLYRPLLPVWLSKLDYLLDAWLYAVPLWVNTFSLIYGFDHIQETGRNVTRLYEEYKGARYE